LGTKTKRKGTRKNKDTSGRSFRECGRRRTSQLEGLDAARCKQKLGDEAGWGRTNWALNDQEESAPAFFPMHVGKKIRGLKKSGNAGEEGEKKKC